MVKEITYQLFLGKMAIRTQAAKNRVKILKGHRRIRKRQFYRGMPILASVFLLTGMLMNTESNSAAVRNLFSGAMKYYQKRRQK